MVDRRSPSRRERLRAEATREIKQAAWSQVHAAGADRLSLRAVADAVGMSPAGLYRYYGSRDDLLGDLAADAFGQLARAVERARDAGPDASHGDRLLAACLAYRQWASDQPRAFALLYGGPVADEGRLASGQVVAASLGVARAFVTVLAAAWHAGDLPVDAALRLGEDSPGGQHPLAGKAAGLGVDLPAALLAAGVGLWGRLHGLVCLEVFGHLEWTGHVAGAVLEEQLRADLGRLGLAPSR